MAYDKQRLMFSTKQMDLVMSMVKRLPAHGADWVYNDIAPDILDTMTTTDFLEYLHRTFQDFLKSVVKTLPHEVPKSVNLPHYCFITAANYMGISGKEADDAKAYEWLCASARYGHTVSICFSAFLPNDPHNLCDTRIPSRLFLIVLALCGSGWAMETLSCKWPSHYQMVGRTIRERQPALSKARHAMASQPEFFFLDAFRFYLHEPTTNDDLLDLWTLSYIGDTKGFEECLDELNSSKDFNMSQVLHMMANFPDHQAAQIVRGYYLKGATLDEKSTTYSAILESHQVGGGELEEPRVLSPLSAAIMRGKTRLALEILHLHQEFNIGIPDFSDALMLSFIYLHPQTSEALLKLLGNNPEICNFIPPKDTGNHLSSFLSNILDSIVSSTGHETATPKITLVRKAIHGLHYNTAYEATLKCLIKQGADFCRRDLPGGYSLATALQRDNAIVVKTFFQAKALKELDPFRFIEDPDLLFFLKYNFESIAAMLCLLEKSDKSFNFLLDTFTKSLISSSFEDGGTLLHYASAVSNVEIVKSLLKKNANVMAMDNSSLTPLATALLRGQIPSADAIADHCSDRQLRQLLQRDTCSGRSIFSKLLYAWASGRQPRLIKGISWVITKNGAHYAGPDGVPAWFCILGRTRPFSQEDQIYDGEIIDLLLRVKDFSDRVDAERWRGMTLFQSAASNGHVKIVKYLIQLGVDIHLDLGFNVKNCPAPALRLAKAVQSIGKFTICDIVGTRCALHNIPDDIKRQGAMAQAEWMKDLDEILNILLDNGCETADLDCLQENLPSLSSLFEEAFKDPTSCSGILGERPKSDFQYDNSHTWPKPISTVTAGGKGTDNVNTPFDKLVERCNNYLGTGPRGREQKRKDIKEREGRQEQFERSKCPRLSDELKYDVHLSNQQWRLPPDWTLVGITKVGSEGGEFISLFENKEAGMLSIRKPPLYKPAGHSASAPQHEQDTGDHTVDVNHIIDFKSGNNVLHFAVALDYVQGLKLMATKIPLNDLTRQKNKGGMTPRQLAEHYGHEDAIAALCGYDTAVF